MARRALNQNQSFPHIDFCFLSSQRDASATAMASPPSTRATRGRGRPRNQDVDSVAASWNDEDVRVLFELRYKTMAAWFEGAKTSKQVNEAWSLVAIQLCVNRVKVFTATQCRAKMRTRWTATRRRAMETRNRPAPRAPKRMDVMTEY
ncbi:hypothetical protein PPTG_00871 [Phytophthora nicotianae INRA-310]|uniref:Uncharacterized protein n=2 Tax=Phytophthora nicotianae TaxID=4792 RepID=W2RJ54_PHYN3|nr:hypothetical protein PPTG_00871 [Phytophthora nicotianae INRA-310]ETN24640.1 hypothetical protein PPTG_00871 [Phytophthora nicotianae INRA-310]